MEKIKDRIKAAIAIKQLLLSDELLLNKIQTIVDTCVTAIREKRKIFFCGNGGSAADAQHLATELSGKFYLDRAPLFAEALHVNTSYLTAVANDYSFAQTYARLVQAKCEQGDIIFGLSTSGNSENVIRAFQQAQQLSVLTIGFTGQSGGRLKENSDYWIPIPSKDTPRIQEAHLLIGHIICEFIEQSLFGEDGPVTSDDN